MRQLGRDVAGGSVAGDDDGLGREGRDDLAQGPLHRGVVAAGQVGAPDRAREQDVPRERQRSDEVQRRPLGVSGRVPGDDAQTTELEDGVGGTDVVDRPERLDAPRCRVLPGSIPVAAIACASGPVGSCAGPLAEPSNPSVPNGSASR